jgi:acyl-CoA synthetase (NDP forming)
MVADPGPHRHHPLMLQAMRALLDPKAIAVVGASQQPGRGTSVVANLRDAGFGGEIFAVNPRYTDVLGYRCFPSVNELPDTVDCLVIAIPARAACDAMEQAFARGIRAAVVLASGFDDDDKNGPLGTRLKALADKGMAICGPNCFGIVNVNTGAVAFNGVVPKALLRGPVALVSQSGSLGNFAFGPLIRDRKLGFSYFVSCGNQIGLTIEDYVDYFADDPDVKVIAAIVEDLKNPRKLERVAATARAKGKPLVFVQIGRTAAGQVMTQSHTGALAGNAKVMAAFLCRCGIVEADSYDEFVETVALFAHVSPGASGNDVVLVSGSGGGAALAADQLDAAGLKLAKLDDATGARMRIVLPDVGDVTNPIDVTGAVFYDASIMGRLIEAVASDPGRPIIATAVNATPAPHDRMRRIASAIADAARNTGATIVAYQVSPLGPLDAEFVEILHRANVPLLMGAASAMNALKHLPRYRAMTVMPRVAAENPKTAPLDSSFMSLHRALRDSGVAVIEAVLARSESESLDAFRRFNTPVALKAEAPGLLHKSDIGGVRLNCASEAAVAEAFRIVTENARRAGFNEAAAIVQPMVSGVAEAYAGIIDDPLYGPAIVFGLGGIFIEVLKDTAIEMAPLSQDDALAMIHRIKAAPLLLGARGRPRGDIAALATLLVNLGRFAVAHTGQIKTLDLNPIIVRPEGGGVVAVDIAVEPADRR